MCSSLISEFNIEIGNLIFVFRFKFLQLIHAIIKNKLEFFVSIVENPRITSSLLLSPFFFLFFFRPWKLTAHTRSITFVVESAANASSLNLRDNLHREQRGEKATASRQRSACGRFSTMSLTHFGRSRCHCNIRIARHLLYSTDPFSNEQPSLFRSRQNNLQEFNDEFRNDYNVQLYLIFDT